MSSRLRAGQPRLRSFVAGAGPFSALLTAAGTGALTLVLLDERGKKLAAVSGRSSLNLRRTLSAGKYTLRISSRTSTQYRLQLEYVRPG
jgi:hypothetical protein